MRYEVGYSFLRIGSGKLEGFLTLTWERWAKGARSASVNILNHAGPKLTRLGEPLEPTVGQVLNP